MVHSGTLPAASLASEGIWNRESFPSAAMLQARHSLSDQDPQEDYYAHFIGKRTSITYPVSGLACARTNTSFSFMFAPWTDQVSAFTYSKNFQWSSRTIQFMMRNQLARNPFEQSSIRCADRHLVFMCICNRVQRWDTAEVPWQGCTAVTIARKAFHSGAWLSKHTAPPPLTA